MFVWIIDNGDFADHRIFVGSPTLYAGGLDGDVAIDFERGGFARVEAWARPLLILGPPMKEPSEKTNPIGREAVFWDECQRVSRSAVNFTIRTQFLRTSDSKRRRPMCDFAIRTQFRAGEAG